MLVVKVYVNEKQIDEIWVHNKGEDEIAKGFYKYTIEKPKKDMIFYHERKLGYESLLEKVLKFLVEEKDGSN